MLNYKAAPNSKDLKLLEFLVAMANSRCRERALEELLPVCDPVERERESL